MKFKEFKKCFQPKRIAWATWSILSNNPVTKNVYLLFCLIDFLIVIFYSFLLVEKVHFANVALYLQQDGNSAT